MTHAATKTLHAIGRIGRHIEKHQARRRIVKKRSESASQPEVHAVDGLTIGINNSVLATRAARQILIDDCYENKPIAYQTDPIVYGDLFIYADTGV